MGITPTTNPTQALEWLSRGGDIQLKDNQFVCCNWKNKISVIFNRKKEQAEVKKIINFIRENLEIASDDQKVAWINLSDKIIKKYAGKGNLSKIVALFDREIVTHKSRIDFSHPKLQASFKKWKSYGMSEELYINHPEFCTFLESSGLLSQIKVTRNTGDGEVRPRVIDGEAALFVDGQWMKWPQFKDSFEVVHSSTYQENFIVNKETREVYTYLDNGKGLQPHHPYLTELSPISKLNEEEYQKVLNKAHCFIRSEEAGLTDTERAELNKDRNFVIQIVSSHIDGMDSNASNLVYRSKHPYLRLIVGKDNPALKTYKGDVYEVGYGWKSKVHLPLVATQGQFRSPDLWEYKSSKEKVVTNVPVTKEEAYAFYKYTQGYFRDGVNLGKSIGFHLVHQNCSSYVRAALQAAGITVPTEISLNDLLHDIAPNWIRNIGKALSSAKKTVKTGISRSLTFLPQRFKNGCGYIANKVNQWVLKVFETVTAFSLVPFKVALGGVLGKGGVAFKSPKKAENDIAPELSHWRDWFQLSHYKFNLPGVLQRWQREQASTVVSKNPVKFAIVPS